MATCASPTGCMRKGRLQLFWRKVLVNCRVCTSWTFNFSLSLSQLSTPRAAKMKKTKKYQQNILNISKSYHIVSEHTSTWKQKWSTFHFLYHETRSTWRGAFLQSRVLGGQSVCVGDRSARRGRKRGQGHLSLVAPKERPAGHSPQEPAQWPLHCSRPVSAEHCSQCHAAHQGSTPKEGKETRSLWSVHQFGCQDILKRSEKDIFVSTWSGHMPCHSRHCLSPDWRWGCSEKSCQEYETTAVCTWLPQ